jgi:phosphopantothenoylcysteine decarboxylase/phosphopantothenate--cysteine ligase
MHLLITAGPTREPIDPVRYISNRSSGRMGYAVAEAGLARGHIIRLVSGPVQLAPPPRAAVFRVETAADMLAAVSAHVPWCDALVMAAAVADWRPAAPAGVKLKKDRTPRALNLERTPDILEGIRALKGGRVFVGFAAETGDPVPEARRKLRAKGLDLIVANDVTQPGAGFEVDTNRVTLISADGATEPLPLLPKAAVAERIVAWIEARLAVALHSDILAGGRFRHVTDV